MKNVKQSKPSNEPKQKTVGLRPGTHQKLDRFCTRGRFGSYQNTIDFLLDLALEQGLEKRLPRPQSPKVRDRASNTPQPVPA